jgi:16S rRNA (guanine966-N2)-methyltransferase
MTSSHGRRSRPRNTPSRKPGSGVRISAGRWKGRVLEVPAGARPTSSRAREALFDILGPRIGGARVVDLHAGSGTVALEALSRGAGRAVLVDVDAASARRNVEKLGTVDLNMEVEVLETSARDAVRRLRSRGDRFDVVFSDPPYAAGPRPPEVADVLAPGGVLVVQTDTSEEVPAPPGLRAAGRRAYGRNVFHFFRHEEPPVAR